MFAWWIALLVVVVLVMLVFLFYLSLVASIYPEKLSTSEVTTITTSDIWRLRMCRYRKGRTQGEPVLFVHGLATNQHSFASPPGASFVDYLMERGYDCWTIDLRGARSSTPPFEHNHTDATLDGQLIHDIPAAINHIRRSTGYARVHWVGHSMGGLLLYAYAQDFGDDYLASGVTLGTPVTLEGLDLRVPKLPVFLATRFPGLCGALLRAYVPFGVKLRLMPRVFPTNVKNVHPDINGGHFYNMIEAPLPRVIREIVFWARKRVIRLDADELDVVQGMRHMRFPLLAFHAVRDRFTPGEKVRAFFEELEAPDKEIHILGRDEGYEEDYDHCDLAFAKHGARDIYEPTLQWLQRHPIHERLSREEMGAITGEHAEPLDASQRAVRISGESYAHLAPEAPEIWEARESAPTSETETEAEALQEDQDTPAPIAIRSEVEAVEHELVLLEEEAPAPVNARAKRSAAKVSARRKPAVAKTTVSRTTAAGSKNSVAKAPAKKKPAAKKAAAKKAPAKRAATTMTPAKKKTAAASNSKAKPAAKKPAAKKKATAPKKAAAKKAPAVTHKSKPVAKTKPAARKSAVREKEQAEVSASTRRALSDAAAELQRLQTPGKGKK